MTPYIRRSLNFRGLVPKLFGMDQYIIMELWRDTLDNLFNNFMYHFPLLKQIRLQHLIFEIRCPHVPMVVTTIGFVSLSFALFIL
jgi:hypothetical protein